MGFVRTVAQMMLGALAMLVLVAVAFLAGAAVAHAESPPPLSLQYRATLTREAQFMFGLQAPIPALAAQLEQESGWRANVTAWDNGRGLAQFMDATSKFLTQRYTDLGTPDPYNPTWAIRAQVRLNSFNVQRVQGATPCEKWGAAFKGYNAGLGYVQRAQAKSSAPAIWFGTTEWINAGQSDKNFEYSRLYPRWIIYQRQAKYLPWGDRLCSINL